MLRVFFFLLVAALLAACGGGSASIPAPTPPGPPLTIHGESVAFHGNTPVATPGN